MATKTAEQAAFEWGEPQAEVRTGRGSWKDEASAVEPIDKLVQAFHGAFPDAPEGYSRSIVKGFEYPALELPAAADLAADATAEQVAAANAEHEKALTKRQSRIAARVNERAAALEVPVHARLIRGQLHMVKGTKPVVTRNRSGKDSAATAAAE